MTADEIDALDDYTDAQLLKLYRHAFAQGWWGQSKSIDGRSWTFPDHNKMLDLIERLDARVASEDDENGNGVSLVTFGSPPDLGGV